MKNIIYLLLILTSNFSFSQVESMTIRGVEYMFVGDSFMEYRDGRIIHPYYTNNLMLYVQPFVENAILAGENLDLGETITTGGYMLDGLESPLLHNTIVFGDGYYGETVSNNIGGTSFFTLYPGFSITINRYWWDRYDEISRRKLIYHELGHGLLHRGHDCDATLSRNAQRVRFYERSIMATGACGYYNIIGERCPDDSESWCVDWGRNFSLWSVLWNDFKSKEIYLPGSYLAPGGAYAGKSAPFQGKLQPQDIIHD